ncbi:MAG: MucBP domain-containing protein [Streptococcus dysgalactiae]|nr:MucBP domain-containing protein [Streptococcus dysgalactiae]
MLSPKDGEVSKIYKGFNYTFDEDYKEGFANTLGTPTTSYYEEGEKLQVTYLYVKTIKTEELTGSFQEHHDYYDMERAFDGTILKRTKNTNLSYSGQMQSGKETEHYTTQKNEQDDYKFLTVTGAKNEPVYNNNGETSQGNFVANVKKEVTYEYEKVNQPGRFEDTHKYFINYVDANGQVIRTEEVNSLTNQYQEGMPEWDEYVAYPLEKDGFVFKTTSDDKLTNPGNFDKETKITRGSYIPGEMQRITYNYYKDVLLSGTVIATYGEFGTGQPLSDAVFATYGKTDKELPNGAGQLNDDYVTVAKDIPGYHLVEQPENAKGKVSDGVTYVHYLYQKDKEPLGTVIVRHIEFGTGKELAPSEYATYDDVPADVPAGSTVAGTGYETKPAQIDGYDLVEVPENDYGNVVEGITRLTYVYKKQIITGQGEIIDFELESNGDESGQNEQPDEISEHGPLVELEYPSQEGMSGENSGQQTIEEDTPTVTIEEKPVVKPVSSQPSKAELPATGERSETAVTVLGLVLSSLGMITIKRNKKSKQ